MFTAAFWTMVAVAALSATAQTFQAVQQKQANERNAEIAEENARRAHEHALNIQKQADQERNQLRLQALQASGTQRAEGGASGFALGAGTSNDMAADIESAFDLDMKNLNYDIAQREWQQNQKAAEYQTMANQLKYANKNFEQNLGIIWGGAALSVAAGMGASALASRAVTTAVASASPAAAFSAGSASGIAQLAANAGFSTGLGVQTAVSKMSGSLAGLK
jgi:hypothetical protein